MQTNKYPVAKRETSPQHPISSNILYIKHLTKQRKIHVFFDHWSFISKQPSIQEDFVNISNQSNSLMRGCSSLHYFPHIKHTYLSVGSDLRIHLVSTESLFLCVTTVYLHIYREHHAILTASICRLLPLAAVLTPNIPEAEILSGRKIGTPEDMTRAARAIGEAYGCAVLCKGGHQVSDANDFLWQPGGEGRWFRSRRVDNPNTHGTGCTLSSAIASNLAKGFDLETAVRRSKDYIFGALSAQLNLGRGSGPMDHMWDLRSRFTGGRADL